MMSHRNATPPLLGSGQAIIQFAEQTILPGDFILISNGCQGGF